MGEILSGVFSKLTFSKVNNDLVLISLPGCELYSTTGPLQPRQLGNVDLHRRWSEIRTRQSGHQLHHAVVQVHKVLRCLQFRP